MAAFTLPAAANAPFALEAQEATFAGSSERAFQQRQKERKQIRLRGLQGRVEPGASSSQRAAFTAPALAGVAVAVASALRRRQQRKQLSRKATGGETSAAQTIYKDVLRTRTQKTLQRILIPTGLTVLGAFLAFPALAHCSKVFAGGALAYADMWDNFVGQWIAMFGLLFSILAGSSYGSLYAQNEAIYFAFYSEVSEAKALVEQVSLISQGRSIYDTLLKYIEQYVKEDLRRTDKDPAEQLAMKPKDDPLESILYITSVGLPSSIYDTVRSIRQLRGQRLGALQRKMPRIQLVLLWILGSCLIAGFPMMAAGEVASAGTFAMRALFGVLCGSVSLTLRVIHEIWRTTGGAYNVDSVLNVAVHGLEEELRLRRQGKAFSFTSLPPPPSYAPLQVSAEEAVNYGGASSSTEESK